MKCLVCLELYGTFQIEHSSDLVSCFVKTAVLGTPGAAGEARTLGQKIAAGKSRLVSGTLNIGTLFCFFVHVKETTGC